MTELQVPAVAPVHLDTSSLEAGLDVIGRSPRDRGTLELIVRRPDIDGREVLDEAELSTTEGVVGDTWLVRGSGRTPDGRAHPDMQLNVINARLSRLVGGDDDEVRALTGDQLHVDLDLSVDNLPPGTRLAVGDAVIEITDQPHTGCAKFAARFGKEVLRFVNVGVGKQLRLRGINAKVVVPGTIRRGDAITKL
jgi:MOSC domain